MDDVKIPREIQLGQTQIRSKNVRVGPDILLDEVTLESESVTVASPARPGETSKVMIEELSLRIVLSEPNLNAIVSAKLPASAPVRNLSIALLTEKMRITGKVAKFPIPFTLEAKPRIINGVRIEPDFLNLNASVVRLPSAVTEVLEKWLREDLMVDLTAFPFAVYLSTARCEPGRLVIEGKARIQWPPAASASPPFSTHAVSASTPAPTLPAPPEQKTLSAADEDTNGNSADEPNSAALPPTEPASNAIQ